MYQPSPTNQPVSPSPLREVSFTLLIPAPAPGYTPETLYGPAETVVGLVHDGYLSTDQAARIFLAQALAAVARSESSYETVDHLRSMYALLYPEAVPAETDTQETE